MAKPRPSGDKRRREREKQRKRQEKVERRKQRKEDKDAGITGAPEIVDTLRPSICSSSGMAVSTPSCGGGSSGPRSV